MSRAPGDALRQLRPSPGPNTAGSMHDEGGDVPSVSASAKVQERKVSDVMTSRVYTVTPDWTLLSTARLLRNHHISGLPVIDGHDHVVGVISETDLVNDLHASTGLGSARGLLDLVLTAGGYRGRDLLEQCLNRLKHTKVSEAMRAPAITVEQDAPLREAARLLHGQGVNRLPVVDGGRLVGILTRQDVVAAILAEVAEAEPTPRRRFARGPE